MRRICSGSREYAPGVRIAAPADKEGLSDNPHNFVSIHPAITLVSLTETTYNPNWHRQSKVVRTHNSFVHSVALGGRTRRAGRAARRDAAWGVPGGRFQAHNTVTECINVSAGRDDPTPASWSPRCRGASGEPGLARWGGRRRGAWRGRYTTGRGDMIHGCTYSRRR
jgi:hypothetical protein